MNIRDLVAHIGFSVDDKPLEKLEGLLEGIKHRLELFAGAELVKKLAETTEHFAEWGEELHTTAENLGMNVEELQLLNQAASNSGVSQGEMSQALAILSSKLYAARNGSKEAALSFARVGITAEQVKGFKSAEDALFALSTTIQGIGDPVKRLAVSREMLGRGGAHMVSFLAQGSVAMKEQMGIAKKLGLTLSEGQVEALEKASHAFNDLHDLLRAIGATIAATIGPAFTYLIGTLVEFYAANKAIIGVNIHRWLLAVAYGMGFVVGLFIGLTRQVMRFAKALGVDKDVLKFIGVTAGAIGALTALGVAFSYASGVFMMAAPFLEFAAILGVIIFVVHDLWALLNDTPTWTGDIVDWVANLKPVKEFFESIQDEAGGLDFSKIGEKIKSSLTEAIKSFLSPETFKGIGDLLGEIFTVENAQAVGMMIMAGLKAALEASAFAYDLGITIATAIVAGLVGLLRAQFPVLANLVLGKEGAPGTGTADFTAGRIVNGALLGIPDLFKAISASIASGNGFAIGSGGQTPLPAGGMIKAGPVYNVAMTFPPGIKDPHEHAKHMVETAKTLDADHRRQTANATKTTTER